MKNDRPNYQGNYKYSIKMRCAFCTGLEIASIHLTHAMQHLISRTRAYIVCRVKSVFFAPLHLISRTRAYIVWVASPTRLPFQTYPQK